MTWQQYAILIASLTNLAACAGSKDSVLDGEGDTIKSIYETHLSSQGLEDRDHARAALGHRPVYSDDRDLYGYVREAFNELDVRFPRLPNPTLVLYVFPHLVGNERVPVPGYATTFQLYAKPEYALPGELNEPAMRTPADK